MEPSLVAFIVIGFVVAIGAVLFAVHREERLAEEEDARNRAADEAERTRRRISLREETPFMGVPASRNRDPYPMPRARAAASTPRSSPPPATSVPSVGDDPFISSFATHQLIQSISASSAPACSPSSSSDSCDSSSSSGGYSSGGGSSGGEASCGGSGGCGGGGD